MPRGKFARKIRPIVTPIGPSIAYVPLTQGCYALIDAEDAEKVSGYNWFAYFNKHTKSHYAKRAIPDVKAVMPLHVHIFGVDRGTLLDHKNAVTLDNRKCNLRRATYAQNTYNSATRKDSAAGIKGVRLVKRSGRWQARITVDGRRKSLGVHETKESAAIAYREAAALHAQEFARVA